MLILPTSLSFLFKKKSIYSYAEEYSQGGQKGIIQVSYNEREAQGAKEQDKYGSKTTYGRYGGTDDTSLEKYTSFHMHTSL